MQALKQRTERLGAVPLRRLGTRRTTRAHLALAHRPEVGLWAEEGLEAVARALEALLGCPVRARARMLEPPVDPERALMAQGAWALIELGALGVPCALEVEYPLLLALLERVSGTRSGPAPVTSLTRIEKAAFGFLCLTALDALRKEEPLERKWAPRLSAVSSSRDEVLEGLKQTPHLGIELVLSVDGHEGFARLYLPARALEASIQDVPRAKPKGLARRVAAANILLDCRLRARGLPVGSIDALSPGDAVLFGDARRVGDRVEATARLLSRHFQLEGRFGPEGFTVTRAVRRAIPQEKAMSDDPTLPIDIEVELARLPLPVGDLADLREGTVLPLKISASQPVVLRVGDRAVARAELVDIEGEVGARILSLLV